MTAILFTSRKLLVTPGFEIEHTDDGLFWAPIAHRTRNRLVLTGVIEPA